MRAAAVSAMLCVTLAACGSSTAKSASLKVASPTTTSSSSGPTSTGGSAPVTGGGALPTGTAAFCDAIRAEISALEPQSSSLQTLMASGSFADAKKAYQAIFESVTQALNHLVSIDGSAPAVVQQAAKVEAQALGSLLARVNQAANMTDLGSALSTSATPAVQSAQSTLLTYENSTCGSTSPTS